MECAPSLAARSCCANLFNPVIACPALLLTRRLIVLLLLTCCFCRDGTRWPTPMNCSMAAEAAWVHRHRCGIRRWLPVVMLVCSSVYPWGFVALVGVLVTQFLWGIRVLLGLTCSLSRRRMSNQGGYRSGIPLVRRILEW